MPRRVLEDRVCPSCGLGFRPRSSTHNFCTRRCSALARIAAGFRPTKPVANMPPAEELKALYESGLTGAAISRQIGCSRSAVTRMLRLTGVAMRPRGSDGGRATKGKRGPLRGRVWKGGRIVRADGYIDLWMPEHPGANKKGYIAEHRFVWWDAHGPIQQGMHVHHIDGNPGNNSLDNLLALPRREHHLLHGHGGARATREQASAGGRKGAASRWGR